MIGATLAMLPALSASAAISPSPGTSNFYWPSGNFVFERTPSGTISSVPVSPPVSALALDPTTGTLYGNSTGFGLTLYRIASDGTSTNLGTPTGYTGTTFSSLAFDAQGHLWGVSAAGSTAQVLSEIDVTTNRVIKAVTLSTGVAGDLAWVDGQLYGGLSAIQRIDTTTGNVVTSVPVTGLFTAAYWSSQGHLYTAAGGGIREVIGRDTATPTLVPVVTSGVGPTDGASDPTAPNPFLNAADDDFTGTPLTTAGGTTATVFGNDTNNGAAFATTDVTPTITDDGGLTGATIAADGTITVPAGATTGTHTLTYQLCRTAAGQTAICDTATVQLRVRDLIAATDDDFTAAPVPAAGGTAGNVLNNDTLNGASIDASTVTATITDNGGLNGVSLGADGTLTVPANVAAGDHQLRYQVCENGELTNCATAAVIFTVRASAVTPPPAGPTSSGAPTPTASPSIAPVSADSALADTGNNLGWAAPAGALALLVAGAVALIVARRRRTV